MFSIALVIFREVLEIALILGVLLAATKGLPKRSPWVWIGLVLGVAGSIVVAIFADAISQAAQGMGQEMMNAVILFIAAFLIGWTVLWMTRHGRELTHHFKEVGQAVIKGRKPMYTLALVVALSVLREGAEIVMFTYSALVTGSKAYQLVLGGALGVCAGAAMGVAIYYGLMKVPTKQIFAVTSWLLVFLVAGMVGQGVNYLAAAGQVPDIIPMVWDTSRILAENSLLGKVMHILVGYTERPSGIQMIAYVLTIAGMALALKSSAPKSQVTAKNVVVALLGLACLLGAPFAQASTKKVYSPIVEQGEWEVEAKGVYDFDHKRPAKNDVQEQEYALGYGAMSRWFTEVEGEVEKERNDENQDLQWHFTQMEWENVFQLTEQGQYWLDAGFFLGYDPNFEDKHSDTLEWKVLLEKSTQHMTHSVNLNFSEDVGGTTLEQVSGGVSWLSRYRFKDFLQPGVEYYADFGPMRSHTTYTAQSHQVGPVLYGHLVGPHIKYDVGYLFGISPAAPLGELKWNVEYEMRF